MDDHQSAFEKDQSQTKTMSVVTKIPSSSPSLPIEQDVAAAAQASACAVANIKYHNDVGRQAVLSAARAVHYDFGSLSTILNVSIDQDDLKRLAADPNIAWVDREGAVYFIQPPK